MNTNKYISRRTALRIIGKSAVLSMIPFSMQGSTLSINEACSKKAFVRVCARDNKYLELTDGRPYIPIGLNFCWPPFSWDSDDEGKTLSEIDTQLRNLSKNRGNFIRIWLSAAFFEPEIKAGIYDEHIARRMDHVMETAEKYGIYVKLCFEHFRKLEGETPSHGVRGKTYDKPIYKKSNGGVCDTMEEYFSMEEGLELFVKRMEFFASRYRDNPYVFGVELWNEVNSIDDVKEDTIRKWNQTMLKKQKELFPNHLSLQSFGSFEKEGQRAEFKEYLTMEGNELSQVHRYHLPEHSWNVICGPMDITCSNAIQEVLAFSPNRPVLLAEIGVAQARYTGRSELHDFDKEGIILHDMLFAPFFAGAAGPGHCWYWDVYVQEHDLWYHFDRFAEAIKEINPIEENFVPFTINHPQLRIYGLRGNNKTILWCRDSKSDMVSELIEKKNPSIINEAEIKFGDSKYKKVKCYDPWKNKWLNGKISGMCINPPPFCRSIVIQLSVE
ncbi:MAG: cellulase family glycosylhydrolase [Tannerella sp.]|nr:cellulase family glycosylhydrolase [Tannerella sp.]